jgi:hypothetical protein
MVRPKERLPNAPISDVTERYSGKPLLKDIGIHRVTGERQWR